MIKITITQVKKELGSVQSFSFKVSAGEIDLDEDQFFLAEDAFLEGMIKNKGTVFEITGRISVRLKQCCSRCLEDMVTVLNVPFSEEYRETDLKEDGEAPDAEVNYFSGNEIDITDLIRETILLAEPIKPVCSETCRGLCPKCGANLNINTCGCNSAKVDPRLAVLGKLLSKD